MGFTYVHEKYISLYTSFHLILTVAAGTLFTSGMLACLEAVCQPHGNPKDSAVSIVLALKLV